MRRFPLFACLAVAMVAAGCIQSIATVPPETAPASGFTDTSVFPGAYDTTGSFSRVLQAGPLAIGDEEVHYIESEVDGAAIQIGLVRPVTDEPVPVILAASPYFRHLVAGEFSTSHTSNPTFLVDFLVENYVPHGYAVALLPVRGTGGSGGCYTWWGEAEQADIGQAVRHLAGEPWSTGAVGAIGLSLGGAAAWTAAGRAPEHVKTIVPVASETDFYSWFVRNGTSAVLAGPGGTSVFYGVYSMSPLDAGPFIARPAERVVEAAVCPEAVTNLAGSVQAAVTGGSDALGMMAARDLRPAVEAGYDGSVFLVHGFNDLLAYAHLVYPWVNELEDQGIVVKHLLGQWRHRMPDDEAGNQPGDPFYNPTPRHDWAEILLRWFDRWLKDEKHIDLGPRVQVADSSYAWRNEEQWPPGDAAPWRLHLTTESGLSEDDTTAPGTAVLLPEPTRSLTSFERWNGPELDCTTCVTFSTPALEAATRFAGSPLLHVTVTPLGPGGHVTAWLYVANGDAIHRVGWATMDLRFADGGTQPGLVVPGKAMLAPLELEPLDVVVPAGGRLVLEVFQGGYGEGFDAYIETEAFAPAAYYRMPAPSNPVLLHTGEGASVLRLATFERDEGALFEVPGSR